MEKIIYGDCLTEMKHIESGSVDLILTDPPYNIARKNNFPLIK
jgi:DNA modification methylase